MITAFFSILSWTGVPSYLRAAGMLTTVRLDLNISFALLLNYIWLQRNYQTNHLYRIRRTLPCLFVLSTCVHSIAHPLGPPPPHFISCARRVNREEL